MALRFVVANPDRVLTRLPWARPLDAWGNDFVVPLPRGISRHVVRVVRGDSHFLAIKETQEELAFREYAMLRRLKRLALPAVEAHGVVTGRQTLDGEPLPAALMTVHLTYSLPYRSLFTQGLTGQDLPRLVDALVVLLVRLHLAGFFWGDVSLSNVLFRRSAGEFAAYVVDAETGELHDTLTDGQRHYDLDIACTNVFGELLDLQAGGILAEDVDPGDIAEQLNERYEALWQEVTGTEEFASEEMWRIERRVERLNELGFDVEELDISAEHEGSTLRLTPRVVEAGHHWRELQELTGLVVEENQARRLLNDISSYAASMGSNGLGNNLDRGAVARQWRTQVFEKVWVMVPVDLRGKLQPAEVYHEILVHRWLLSERAGHEIDIFETTRDYIDTVLRSRPDEELTTPPADEEINP